MTDNVIKFPIGGIKNKNVDIPTNEEELITTVASIKETFFDTVSVEMAVPIFARATLHGFDVGNEEYIKDCIMIVEAIKSLLMRTKEYVHPIQKYAEENIDYNIEEYHDEE